MEELLRAWLLADEGVRAVVGAAVDWGHRPQSAPLPGIALEVVAAPRPRSFDGPSGFVSYRIRGDCWARDYLTAKRAARALIAALPRQDLATRFRGAEVLNERDGSDEDQSGNPIRRTSIDFRIMFQEGE